MGAMDINDHNSWTNSRERSTQYSSESYILGAHSNYLFHLRSAAHDDVSHPLQVKSNENHCADQLCAHQRARVSSDNV